MSPSARLRPTTDAEDFTRAVAEAYAAGARAHAPVRLPAPDFEVHLGGMAERQARALALADASARRLALARHGAPDDIYLAAACERTLAGAWERFSQHFLPWLRGLLERRGVGASEAEEVAGEAPGLLVVPPKSATARTTLGTWDGRARLSSWLAAITLRRWFARRRATSMSTESLVEPQDRRRAPIAEPLEGLVGGESAQRLLGALDTAWERLTERERLALLLRYRGDLPQTRIAVLLGVGEPRVSRLLGAALERLRAAAGPVLDQAEAQLPGVAAALARWLATRGGYGAPTDVARPSPERSRGP